MTNRFTLVQIIVVAVTGVAVGIFMIVMANALWGESSAEAYQRGKIDGQILVYGLWNIHSAEIINQLADCIHMVNLQRLDEIDSLASDTIKGE